MLANLVELLDSLIDILISVLCIHFYCKFLERSIYLLLQVCYKDILVHKTNVRHSLAGMLVSLFAVILVLVDKVVLDVVSELLDVVLSDFTEQHSVEPEVSVSCVFCVSVLDHLHLGIHLALDYSPLVLIAFAL